MAENDKSSLNYNSEFEYGLNLNSLLKLSLVLVALSLSLCLLRVTFFGIPIGVDVEGPVYHNLGIGNKAQFGMTEQFRVKVE